MTSPKTFFQRETLEAELSGRLKAFLGEVEKIPQQQFEATSDSGIVAHVVARATLEPLVLFEDRAFLDFESTQVDVSRDTYRQFFERPAGPVFVPGRRVILSIPHAGEAWLFEYRTNPFYPHAIVRGDVQSAMFDGGEDLVRLHVLVGNDVGEDILARQLEEARQCLRLFVFASTAQVNGFNRNLESHISQAVAARRSRNVQHQAVAAKLNIPLRKRPEAPPLEPVAIAPRPVPALNPGREREFGISDGDHQLILHFIRHQGRTYESTPDTYAVHGEEGLRDIVLGQLNGHFRGAATGETFRCKGKTDIRIEADDRSAFVAECKLWTGKAGLQKAISQLLGYVMWRDSKAALVVFNKSNTQMSVLVAKVPEAIEATGLAVTEITEAGVGEWSLTVRHSEDAAHLITLSVFAFDIRPRKVKG